MSLNGNEACQETIMTINQIIEDTYVNIGQLEKLLMGYVPAAEHIDNVELDATELLNVNNDAISVEEQL
jgi:hypothetical protein